MCVLDGVMTFAHMGGSGELADYWYRRRDKSRETTIINIQGRVGTES